MILDIVDGVLFVKGLIPGPKGTLIEVKKVGHDKKFTPIFKIVDETPVEDSVEQNTVEEVAVEAPVVDSVEPTVEANIAEDNVQAEEIADEATGVKEESK
jgi:hypothetical protein